MKYNTVFYILLYFTVMSFIGCDGFSEIDDSYYILPTELSNIPSDPNNKITAQKVYLGESLFNWPGLSATGQVSCANCHDPDNDFEAPLRVDGKKTIGGCGEGFRLISKGKNKGKLIAVPGYSGKDDCMDWVKSKGGFNSAYDEIAGLSGRFGGTDDPQLRKDKISHFGLHLSPEMEDKLFSCHSTLFQAFVALAGHRQFFIDRLFDNPELVEQLENTFNVEIKKGITDQDELAFMIACCLDAFQRTALRIDTKFQDHLHGRDTLSELELAGFEIFKIKCRSCHTSPTFSGGIEISHFANIEGFPDCTNDITGVGILDKSKIYRKVPTINPDMDLFGPHGEFDNIEEYMNEHVTFLDSSQMTAIVAWTKTL